MSRRIVVTGTDTGIGKTVFSAGVAHLLGANYWKPISGRSRRRDRCPASRKLGQSLSRSNGAGALPSSNACFTPSFRGN